MGSSNKITIIPDIHEVIESKTLRSEMNKNVTRGGVYVVKNYLPEDLIQDIRTYLTRVAQSTLPNYQKIEAGAPNFHRMNQEDERSYVKGCFHQFVFFPWNQDYFNLFTITRKAYELKNLISNLPADKYLGRDPDDGCTARIAIQFYPSGQGFLNKHKDPVDKHQLTVPTILLSQKGIDFQEGGAYAEDGSGNKTILDDVCGIGDLIYFNAHMVHGVDKINPGSSDPWLLFKGRWMMLLAVNRLFDNTSIPDSTDLGSS